MMPAAETPRLLLLTALLTLVAGCSLRSIAINSVANTLAKGGDTFASDGDTELIREAVPFSLKLVESLLAEVPDHRGLLLTACSGFTQYAYAFVEADAEVVKFDDYGRHSRLQERARRMYLRARDYCLRDLELAHPGIGERLARDPDAAVQVLQKPEVALVYWTGAAWGKAVALSLDHPAIAGDLPIAQALMRRALVLDEAFNAGAVHEAMITFESLPADMGGDRARAAKHYARALELSAGDAAGPHLAYAVGVLLPQQEREAFVELLDKALAVDIDRNPKLRLANTIAQHYAAYLLHHLDELFLADKEARSDPQDPRGGHAGSGRARVAPARGR
jgi:predicted anti-sigma-YlaC factor YlaD